MASSIYCYSTVNIRTVRSCVTVSKSEKSLCKYNKLCMLINFATMLNADQFIHFSLSMKIMLDLFFLLQNF